MTFHLFNLKILLAPIQRLSVTLPDNSATSAGSSPTVAKVAFAD